MGWKGAKGASSTVATARPFEEVATSNCAPPQRAPSRRAYSPHFGESSNLVQVLYFLCSPLGAQPSRLTGLEIAAFGAKFSSKDRIVVFARDY